ncbi:MAG: hypothetical protein P8013_06320 [Candidatus Sulfobium sp.]|jgi:hypothetical protein
MKLGEALIEAGLITRQQLDVALERQTMLGGRIDTNIVELRFLSDEALTRFLGKFLRLPIVTTEALRYIPAEVIRIVGRKMAENYMIIPFALERQKLHVAMLNPKNIRDIDNLRFTTGYEIIPYVITESRLLHALEKYYGIKRETRYISLKDRFDPDAGTDDLSERIERISGEAIGKAADKRPAQRYSEPEKALKGAEPGLIEALLLNAMYTAKLFYRQQGLSPDDGSIEDEVLAAWARLSKKSSREEEEGPFSLADSPGAGQLPGRGSGG